MNKTPTPHINAKLGDIAKTVIMPGDPLRAQMIAKNFLTDAKLVSDVRNNFCFTGTYKGKQISVMSSGMGCASMGIYSYELFNFYDVENIIRVGTMGSLKKDIKLKDLVVAQNVLSDSNYNHFNEQSKTKKISCSKFLLEQIKKTAKSKDIKVVVDTIWTTDTFYDSKEANQNIIKTGAVGVEMESLALYLNAKKANKNALCVCTISDEILTGEQCSSQERQNSLFQMISLAIDSVYDLR